MMGESHGFGDWGKTAGGRQTVILLQDAKAF